MGQYNWPQERQEKRFSELSELSRYVDKTPSEQERINGSLSNYYMMRNILDSKKEKGPIVQKNIDGSLRDLQEEMAIWEESNNIFMDSTVISIVRTMAKQSYSTVRPTTQIHLSQKEILTKTKEFYSCFSNKKTYRELLYLLRKEPNMFQMEESKISDGTYFPDTWNLIAYVLLYFDGTLMDLYASTHESMHASLMRNNLHYTDKAKLTCEVLPYFMEHCLSLYLRAINYYADQTNLSELQTYYNAVIHAKMATFKLDTYAKIKALGKKDYNNLALYGTDPEIVNCAFKSSFLYIDNVKYVCSYLIAQDMINLCEVRPDLGLKNINKLISNKDNDNILELYESMGITLRSINSRIQSKPKIFIRE